MVDYTRFLSRKFIAMLIGIIVLVVSSIIPELNSVELEKMLWLIFSYILAEGSKDIAETIKRCD
jgi:hypothetical protein